MEWLKALNQFTKNLSEDLKIIQYPIINGQLYKKNIGNDFQTSLAENMVVSGKSQNLSVPLSL